ncbi:MAG: amidase [Caldilineaceae bacterium]|nr:amidase [Caldilineaceae bacterium]
MSQQQASSGDTEQPEVASAVDAEMIQVAGRVVGLDFTASEAELMTYAVNLNYANYETVRELELGNAAQPAFHFDPRLPGQQGPRALPLRNSETLRVTRPDRLEELAFYPVVALAELVRTRQVSACELTEMYLSRLKNYGPQLACVATLTEELARRQAAQADAEIAAGHYRGPLHGIPYGLKDLFATRDYPTSWGAPPYRGQMLEMDATVVERLADAGAILVAKLSMGSLAWDDVWYGGKTKNPWDLTKGSSGSSAGSGAATAAGLVAFAIGTETNGSIISPSRACGVTGLRPTFGRISRHGAMTLSWTLDKVGPMCRTVGDCALVFDAIRGTDRHDSAVVDVPFAWEPAVDLSKFRIGYLANEFETDGPSQALNKETLAVLAASGAELVPLQLPAFPLNALEMILYVEAAAAFDELTRSNRDDLLIRQGEKYWANQFRVARLVPAVEYIQVQRLRRQLIEAMVMTMAQVDLYVAPAEGDNVWVTNLSGHPVVTLLNGFRGDGLPSSVSFVGQLDDEARLLAVTKAYQQETEFHTSVPPLFAP